MLVAAGSCGAPGVAAADAATAAPTGAVGAPPACPNVGAVAEAEWEAAAAALDGAADAGGALPWAEWSRAWLSLGRQVRADLEGSLLLCPEGSVATLMHALTALDAEEGDAASLEIIKLLYHLLSNGRLSIPGRHAGGEPGSSTAAVLAASSPWQRHWLLAATSMLRFVYLKWINVPKDAEVVARSGPLVPAVPGLRSHHAFLFRRVIDEFVSSGVYDLEMTENSVLFSEAFAFVAFCRLHEVTSVLESGVYKGVSTEIWSLFVQDVIGIDIFISAQAEARLAPHSHVRLLAGDGRVLLPRLLEEQPSRRVAVFIDGPKGELAIHLAMRVKSHPQVAFVAMHDMAPYRQELIRMGAVFFTDEAWFQDAYGHLDAPFHSRPDLPAGGTMAFLPS